MDVVDIIEDTLHSNLVRSLILSDDFWVFLGVRFAMTFIDAPAVRGVSGWLHALLFTIIYAMITSQI